MKSLIKLTIIFFGLTISSCNHKVETTNPVCYSCEAPIYEEFFSYISSPELLMYFYYEQGLRCAKAKNKPIFLAFTAHGAVSTREATFAYWLKDNSIFKILKDNYVIIELFVDDKSPLDSSVFYKSKNSGAMVTTIGQKNLDYQISRFNKNSLPFCIALDSNGDDLLEPLFYDGSNKSILKYMQNGLKEFEKKPCKNNSIIIIALVACLMASLTAILFLLNYIKKRL